MSKFVPAKITASCLATRHPTAVPGNAYPLSVRSDHTKSSDVHRVFTVKSGYYAAVPIFEISSQNGCLISWGANKRMQSSGSTYSCVGTD